jgi:hypothetical protein
LAGQNHADDSDNGPQTQPLNQLNHPQFDRFAVRHFDILDNDSCRNLFDRSRPLEPRPPRHVSRAASEVDKLNTSLEKLKSERRELLGVAAELEKQLQVQYAAYYTEGEKKDVKLLEGKLDGAALELLEGLRQSLELTNKKLKENDSMVQKTRAQLEKATLIMDLSDLDLNADNLQVLKIGYNLVDLALLESSRPQGIQVTLELQSALCLYNELRQVHLRSGTSITTTTRTMEVPVKCSIIPQI